MSAGEKRSSDSRHAARLGAVQALYQMEMNGSGAEEVAQEFAEYSILRAILRCGVYELVARRDVPAKVVIDEYVAVAGAFFGADEPGFINAALDTIAKHKRAAEFGLPTPEGELEF
jgi:transcription termination factor NusB